MSDEEREGPGLLGTIFGGIVGIFIPTSGGNSHAEETETDDQREERRNRMEEDYIKSDNQYRGGWGGWKP